MWPTLTVDREHGTALLHQHCTAFLRAPECEQKARCRGQRTSNDAGNNNLQRLAKIWQPCWLPLAPACHFMAIGQQPQPTISRADSFTPYFKV